MRAPAFLQIMGKVRQIRSISPGNRMLFMLDGHSSRIYRDNPKVFYEWGFDILIFPGKHTRVASQPIFQCVHTSLHTSYRGAGHMDTCMYMRLLVFPWISLAFCSGLNGP